MNPTDAMQAHRILQPLCSIAIHHGTFQLADESLDEPARAMRSLTAQDPSFLILPNGTPHEC
jgi:hypothetical protein